MGLSTDRGLGDWLAVEPDSTVRCLRAMKGQRSVPPSCKSRPSKDPKPETLLKGPSASLEDDAERSGID